MSSSVGIEQYIHMELKFEILEFYRSRFEEVDLKKKKKKEKKKKKDNGNLIWRMRELES